MVAKPERTLSQRGSWARNKGLVAERHVVTYLRDMGFPDVERAVRTGYRTSSRVSDDPGDLTGIPGVIVSIKDAQTHYVDAWLRELDEMNSADTLALRLLVIKRAYKRDPGLWRAIMRYPTFSALTGATDTSHGFAVEVTLGDATSLLLARNYHRPLSDQVAE